MEKLKTEVIKLSTADGYYLIVFGLSAAITLLILIRFFYLRYRGLINISYNDSLFESYVFDRGFSTYLIKILSLITISALFILSVIVSLHRLIF